VQYRRALPNCGGRRN